MSCKLLPAGDSRSESRIEWRQVREALDADAGKQTEAQRWAQLERECDERVRAAHAAGRREGEEAGKQRAAAEIQPVLERLAQSVADISGLKARLRREAEQDLLTLSIAIARRVLRREIALDPEALHGLVLAALEKLQAREIQRVRVHPGQVEAVGSWLREVGVSNVEVVSDPGRDPGDVFFETSRGDLDACVNSQLGEIERGLADRLRRRQ